LFVNKSSARIFIKGSNLVNVFVIVTSDILNLAIIYFLFIAMLYFIQAKIIAAMAKEVG
jgi:hypothetical protein